MEWISIKDRTPDKNGKYVVLIQIPSPDCSYVGSMPWRTIFQVSEYIVEPRILGETYKVPFWAHEFNEKDYSFFITHWAELPSLPADFKEHRPDKEKAVKLYFEMRQHKHVKQ